MKAQYEQHCNAAALKGLGVKVIKKLKKKHAPKIEEWTRSDNIIHVDYPDITEQIIDLVLSKFPDINWVENDVSVTEYLKHKFPVYTDI